MAHAPHKLWLYEHAVQHPQAEVRFIDRVFRKAHGQSPLLLREDFAGSCAVAAAWCGSGPDRQAMAVESHGPTLRWAMARHADVADLHGVEADVMSVASPCVDVVVALNFSLFIYHQRSALLGYLRHARRCLGSPGLFVMDCYGGPGAMRVGTQSRRVEPGTGEAFTYHWEQRAFDAVSARTDCRIHFTLADGREMRNVFRYDWRLWTPAELLELLAEAGFMKPTLWCDRLDPRTGLSDGQYRPARRMPAREDWVAYVVGGKE